MALQVKSVKSPKLNETPSSKEASPEVSNNNNAPKYGTVIPNRVFVGGISGSTTEADLTQLFSQYGKVVNTKIIADRAGVSKGYGFVTFDSEEEAKRLQKDAENIVLRERRLNIAPAIKKQSFGRAYETPTPTNAIQAPPIYHQNGVSYAYHNGMAFFSPTCAGAQSASVTPIQSAPVDPAIYQGGYGNNTPHVAYTPSMLYSTPLYFQGPQFPQYQIPYEGCYSVADQGTAVVLQNNNGGGGDTSNLVVPSGQYFVPQPTIPQQYQEMTLAVPATYYPQDPNVPQVYQFRRPYEPPSVLELQNCQNENMARVYPGDGGDSNNEGTVKGESSGGEVEEKQRGPTPVVSLSKLKESEERPRPLPPPRSKHINNNNPDAANRNLVNKTGPSPPPAPYSPMLRPFTYPSENPRCNIPPPTTVQVPQYPYYSAQSPRPYYAAAQTQQRRFPNNHHRRPNNGGSRGKSRGGSGSRNSGGGMNNIDAGGDCGVILGGSSTLTPPTTPRCSPQEDNSQDVPTHAIQELTI